MPAAARVGDPTNHPGVIGGPGVPSVLIGGQPAAVVMDGHACGNPAGHPPSTAATGSATVLIGGRPALRAFDACGCGAQIAVGFPSVQVG
jgi:uncharacterized Zn-binding protein involved in type VI secretion